MTRWIIRRHESTSEEVVGSLSGNYSEKEVSVILQRLVCTTLSVQEILVSSERAKRGEKESNLLDRVGSGFPIQFGHGGSYFTANRSSDEAGHMKQFWLFKAPPNERARVHKADCPNCNFGKGQQGQIKKAGGPTSWTGFATLAEAKLAMSDLQYSDSGLCGTCLSGQLSNW